MLLIAVRFCRVVSSSSSSSSSSSLQFPGDVARGAEMTLSDKETVPDMYIVAPSNDHVRIKYIFLYVVDGPARSLTIESLISTVL